MAAYDGGNMLKSILAGLFALAATPTIAACIVDYETFVVRELSQADDPQQVAEQAGMLYDWYIGSEEVTVRGTRFEKYGLPRVVDRSEILFWGFLGSVPFLIEYGMPPDAPEVIYGMANPLDCEVQAYVAIP